MSPAPVSVEPVAVNSSTGPKIVTDYTVTVSDSAESDQPVAPVKSPPRPFFVKKYYDETTQQYLPNLVVGGCGVELILRRDNAKSPLQRIDWRVTQRCWLGPGFELLPGDEVSFWPTIKEDGAVLRRVDLRGEKARPNPIFFAGLEVDDIVAFDESGKIAHVGFLKDQTLACGLSLDRLTSHSFLEKFPNHPQHIDLLANDLFVQGLKVASRQDPVCFVEKADGKYDLTVVLKGECDKPSAADFRTRTLVKDWSCPELGLNASPGSSPEVIPKPTGIGHHLRCERFDLFYNTSKPTGEGSSILKHEGLYSAKFRIPTPLASPEFERKYHSLMFKNHLDWRDEVYLIEKSVLAKPVVGQSYKITTVDWPWKDRYEQTCQYLGLKR